MTTTHRISAGIALAAALAATTVPASARPLDPNTNRAYAPAAAPSAQASTQLPSAAGPPTIVRVTTSSNGFDWGDAGIGAAGGLALSVIGLGGVLAASGYRSRPGRRTTATTS